MESRVLSSSVCFYGMFLVVKEIGKEAILYASRPSDLASSYFQVTNKHG